MPRAGSLIFPAADRSAKPLISKEVDGKMEEEDFTSEFVGGYKERTETVDEVTREPFAS